jgi:hypothetical protein
MTQEKIIERVRQLLALANNNDNPQEAALAAQRAQELMQRHKVSSAQLDVEDDVEVVERVLTTGKAVSKWKSGLLTGVCEAFCCKAFILAGPTGRRLTLIGKRDDADAAVYVYRYLCAEIERLAKTANGSGKRWINSFKVGAAHEISLRLQQQNQRWRATVDEKTTALVRRDDQAIDDFLIGSKIKRPRNTNSIVDTAAWISGRSAGNKIVLPGKGKGLKAPSERLK